MQQSETMFGFGMIKEEKVCDDKKNRNFKRFDRWMNYKKHQIPKDLILEFDSFMVLTC